MAFVEIRVPQPFTDPEGLIEIPKLGEGILAQWDADTLALADGEQVTSWASTGSLGLVADQTVGSGGYPVLAANSASGHASVRFDGDAGIRAAGQIVPTGGDLTMLVVARADTTSGYILDTDRAAVLGHAVYPTAEHHVWRISGDAGDHRVDSGVAPDSGWAVLVLRRSGDTATMRSTTLGDGAVTATVPRSGITGLVMGSEYRGYSRFQGNVAAIRVYGRALTDLEMDALLAQQARKYGLI